MRDPGKTYHESLSSALARRFHGLGEVSLWFGGAGKASSRSLRAKVNINSQGQGRHKALFAVTNSAHTVHCVLHCQSTPSVSLNTTQFDVLASDQSSWIAAAVYWMLEFSTVAQDALPEPSSKKACSPPCPIRHASFPFPPCSFEADHAVLSSMVLRVPQFC